MAKTGVLTRDHVIPYLKYLMAIQLCGAAWWIYGQLLLFSSERLCGEEMYDLSYVLFWITISILSVLSLGCCLLFGMLNTGNDIDI